MRLNSHDPYFYVPSAIPELIMKTSYQAKKSFKVVVDMDEVLVDISPKWTIKIIENEKIRSYLQKNFNNELEEVLKAHPNNRTNYCIMKHFGENIDEKIKNEMLNVYFNDRNFYDDLHPNNYGLILNEMIKENFISELLVLTKCGHSVNQPVNWSKMKWLQKHFSSCKRKVSFSLITNEEKKSDAIIKSNFNDYATFVDDHLDNILDVMKNTNSREKEFLIPRTTYNSLTHNSSLVEEFNSLSEKINCRTYWFDNSLQLINPKENVYKFTFMNEELKPSYEQLPTELAKKIDW